MEGLFNWAKKISGLLNIIAGISVTFLMFLTVADVILRPLGKPIVGTYELVAFSSAIVIGFSLPLTSWERGHINVDFLIIKLPHRIRNIVNVTTRLLGSGLFLMIGWNLIKYGMDLYISREVSVTLQMPFYPIAYGLGISCFVVCLVLVCDIAKIARGEYE